MPETLVIIGVTNRSVVSICTINVYQRTMIMVLVLWGRIKTTNCHTLKFNAQNLTMLPKCNTFDNNHCGNYEEITSNNK